MHVPDGFLDASTSAATAVLAASAVGIALRRARVELDERAAPLAGLTAAFVFAAQMINFPVGVGTSGHLLGGALAAVLVGPWTALLCLTVVLVVQALLFADGGVTALGTNVTLMGVVTVLVGWMVTRAVLAVAPRRPASVVPASFLGALLSVPASAAAFVGLYALGGPVQLPMTALLASMLGWHLVIGLGEAVITALTVSAVVAVRPDLVHAARGLRPTLRLRTADGEMSVTPTASPPRWTSRRPVAAALGVTVLLAGVVSSFASSSPDGLERVAGDHGFLDRARASVSAASPLGDYAVAGLDGAVSVGLAGLAGVAATVALGWLVSRVAVSRRTSRSLPGPGTSRVPERV